MATGSLYSDRFQSLSQEWSQAMSQFVPTWQNFCRIDTTKSASLTRWADKTPGVLATWDGDAAIADVAMGDSHAQTITPDGKARKVTIRQFDARMDAGLVDRRAADLLAAAERTLESMVYAKLETTFTDSFDNGAGSTTEVISDGHTLADSSAQSNLLTAALSASSLATAREYLRNWKNHNGDFAGLGQGSLALVVAPKNEDVAKQITQSPTLREASAGTGANINPQADRAWQVVCSPYLSADDDDWFVVETGALTPITVWIPSPPALIIEEHASNQNIEMSVAFFGQVFIDTPPNGLVGSKVA